MTADMGHIVKMLHCVGLVALCIAFCGGCTTPIDIASYNRVGGVQTGSGHFERDPAFKLPDSFVLTPETVVSRYGNLCRGTYNCAYFADDEAYYLVQDYGVVPILSLRNAAVAIVNGKTGLLLKGPSP